MTLIVEPQGTGTFGAGLPLLTFCARSVPSVFSDQISQKLTLLCDFCVKRSSGISTWYFILSASENMAPILQNCQETDPVWHAHTLFTRFFRKLRHFFHFGQVTCTRWHPLSPKWASPIVFQSRASFVTKSSQNPTWARAFVLISQIRSKLGPFLVFCLFRVFGGTLFVCSNFWGNANKTKHVRPRHWWSLFLLVRRLRSFRNNGQKNHWGPGTCKQHQHTTTSQHTDRIILINLPGTPYCQIHTVLCLTSVNV